MVDKITTVQKAKIGARIGRLADEYVVRLNRAILVFLGIAAGQSQRLEVRNWNRNPFQNQHGRVRDLQG
jgi:hypothetical protein